MFDLPRALTAASAILAFLSVPALAEQVKFAADLVAASEVPPTDSTGTGKVEATLDTAQRQGTMAEPQSVEDAIAIDHNARRLAVDLLPEIAAMAS